MSSGTLSGLASLIIGGLVSIAVAWISRPKAPPGPPVQERVQDRALEGADLTTVPGLAAVLVEQHTRISELEDREEQAREHASMQDRVIAALRRYVLVLQETVRRAGTEVPEPADEDARLIQG
ncbi:hypothetical protein [Streptomyces aureus]|uniref:hypothetical protein n=1 Tax=Streptomyces aureus TaxID=193461 RepID=UPI00056CBB04|nr:hypothetical protein [Streptomyces aureus]